MATAVETTVLVGWLALVQNTPTASVATGIAFGVLAVGLVVGDILTDGAVNGGWQLVPGYDTVQTGASETAMWAVWLFVADRVGGVRGVVVAGLIFTLLFVFQHTMENNVFRGRKVLSTVVEANTLGASIATAGGATGWLLLSIRGDLLTPLLADASRKVGGRLPVDIAAIDPALIGVLVLTAALFVEHFMAVGFARSGMQSTLRRTPLTNECG